MGIKILPEDSKFSRYIRGRDNWTCQKCGKQYDEGAQGLQNSHFWSRGRWSTRFDPKNCDALCYGCHAQVESNKQGWYRTFKIQQLGSKGYKDLEKRANSYVAKRDALARVNEWLKKNGT